MSHLTEEIASQPDCWRRAGDVAAGAASVLPRPGERVAVIGCGTSWFMASAYAALRESRGLGETDSFAASETPRDRRYDRVVVITRSGTTSEVLDELAHLRGRTPTVAITADGATPVREVADDTVVLDADERAVVQTRFATTALALLRASLGEDLGQLVADGRRALAVAPDDGHVAAEQVTFLGRGWTIGLAAEAALKLRESCQSWTESYPAMEYRHGPISIAAPGRLVWVLGEVPPGLAKEVDDTGAAFEHGSLDPLAELVRVHRLCEVRASRLGLDPDRPRNLTRSVVLHS